MVIFPSHSTLVVVAVDAVAVVVVVVKKPKYQWIRNSPLTFLGLNMCYWLWFGSQMTVIYGLMGFYHALSREREIKAQWIVSRGFSSWSQRSIRMLRTRPCLICAGWCGRDPSIMCLVCPFRLAKSRIFHKTFRVIFFLSKYVYVFGCFSVTYFLVCRVLVQADRQNLRSLADELITRTTDTKFSILGLLSLKKKNLLVAVCNFERLCVFVSGYKTSIKKRLTDYFVVL
jgi:hypothetical protein